VYQREFERLIESSLPKALMLYGDEPYNIERTLKRYQNQLEAKESMMQLYYDEWDFQKAKGYLGQSSLFGETNLLIVRSQKKIPKKELDWLVASAQEQPNNYFLFLFEGAAKDAKTMQSSFTPKSGGIWVRFFELDIPQGVALLQQKAQELKVDINYHTLEYLLSVMQNNLALCIKELEKFAILEHPIDKNTIDSLVYSTAPIASEKMLEDLIMKRPILDQLLHLLQSGEDAFSLFRATVLFFNQLFMFHAYIKLNGRVNSADILGYKLPPKIEQQKAQLALRIKPAALLKIFKLLLNNELQLKKSPPNQQDAMLISTLNQIQSLL